MTNLEQGVEAYVQSVLRNERSACPSRPTARLLVQELIKEDNSAYFGQTLFDALSDSNVPDTCFASLYQILTFNREAEKKLLQQVFPTIAKESEKNLAKQMLLRLKEELEEKIRNSGVNSEICKELSAIFGQLELLEKETATEEIVGETGAVGTIGGLESQPQVSQEQAEPVQETRYTIPPPREPSPSTRNETPGEDVLRFLSPTTPQRDILEMIKQTPVLMTYFGLMPGVAPSGVTREQAIEALQKVMRNSGNQTMMLFGNVVSPFILDAVAKLVKSA